MKFTKMEGCGNDYVYVNGFDTKIEDPNKLSEIVSNRHFGIGSDGLIVINPSDVADFKMSMYNADGSEGKMCGNGIRCVAKYVYDNKMTDKTTITVETLSGIKTLVLNVEDDKVKTVRVNMGSPILESAKVPVVSEKDKVIDEPVMVNNKEYRITCVSMGNPHAITFVDDIDSLDIEHIGPMFEKKEIFPEQVNTEFIQVVSRDVIKMRVWERGSGETLACGTGACASVVACVLNGLTEDKVTVKLLGGDLFIEYNRDEDAVYMTKKEKFNAVVEAVKEAHAKHQPVLVGTINIDTSELLSGMLKREGIPHTVLNAKFHELEAEIVAGAGQHGAVTIATNMAGRGTDIKLDDDARAAGGLKIIGTERHESRRIDNQLRGRSGRQGDVGESQFFISLEDDLMRLFGSDKLMDVFNALGVPENEQIQHKMLTSAIEKAQQKIEANNYGIRKNLLEYDQVMNDQREIIYKERLRVLNGESMRDAIFKMITDRVESCVDTCISSEIPKDEWDLNELNQLLLPIIPLEPITEETIADIKNNKELKHLLKEKAVKLYEAKETEFPEPEQFRELERVVLLKVIDQKWMDHIDDMDQLRQGIGLQAYGQRDPLVEYKMAGFDMFDEMTANIQEDTIRLLYHVKIEQKVEREQVAKVTGTNKDESGPRKPVQRAERKIYPNDPCPCGSGKKYKQCCGRKK